MSNLSGGGAYAVFDGVTIETLVGPAIVDFQADDTYLAPGENTVLRWEVDPSAASVHHRPGRGRCHGPHHQRTGEHRNFPHRHRDLHLDRHGRHREQYRVRHHLRRPAPAQHRRVPRR